MIYPAMSITVSILLLASSLAFLSGEGAHIDDEPGQFRQLIESRIPQDQRRELEVLLSLVDRTPKTIDVREYYKQILIKYLETKGPQATKRAEQRSDLFDVLEEACNNANEQLRDLADVVEGETILKYPQVARDFAKWARVRQACRVFMDKFSRRAAEEADEANDDNDQGQRELFNEVRGLDEFEPKVARGNSLRKNLKRFVTAMRSSRGRSINKA